MIRIATILLLDQPMLAHAALLGTERTWEFMQSVGGITLDAPVNERNGWSLPLLCDVSGLKEFTVKPTLVNSALVWADTKMQVVDQEIRLTIETGVFKLAGVRTACGTAELGKIVPGKYRVVYRDPDGSKHFVGEVEMK